MATQSRLAHGSSRILRLSRTMSLPLSNFVDTAHGGACQSSRKAKTTSTAFFPCRTDPKFASRFEYPRPTRRSFSHGDVPSRMRSHEQSTARISRLSLRPCVLVISCRYLCTSLLPRCPIAQAAHQRRISAEHGHPAAGRSSRRPYTMGCRHTMLSIIA